MVARRFGLAVAVALLLACGADGEVRLLEVSGVEQARVQPGGRLRIAGEGFPVGRACQVTLVGQTHRPGATPVPVTVTLAGRAVSPGRVSVRVDRRAFGALGGGGTFAGTLRVAFDAQAVDMRVVGDLGQVRLDLQRPLEHGLPAQRALRERAERLLGFLGVVVDGEAPTHAGIRVARAEPGSAAEHAGLVQGDVIVEADAVRVHSLSDLAPARASAAVAWQVRRPGQGRPVAIALSLAGFEAPVLDASLIPLCAAVAFALLVGVWFGPLPGPTPFLARVASRLRVGIPLLSRRVWDDFPVERQSLAPKPLLARFRARLGEWTLAFAVTAVLLAIALVEAAVELRFNSLPIYLGLAATRLGIALVTPSAMGPRERRALALKQLGRMAVLGVTICVACAHGGTRCLEGIVGRQGGLPWHWGVFQTPALMLVFPAFILQASRLAPTDLGPGKLATAAAYGLDISARVFLCAIGAAVFLGGWEVTGFGISDPVVALCTGAVLFALKAWAIALILHAGKAVRLGAATPRWAVPSLCAGAALVTGLWLGLGAGEQLQLAVGTVAFIASTALLSTSLLRVWRTPEPMTPHFL